MSEVSKLFASGRIILVRQAVSGRAGILCLWNMLAAGSLGVEYDLRSEEELWLVMTNKRRSRLRILHVDRFGYELITRINYTGRFNVLFDEGGPQHLTRQQLRRLMLDGTAEGEWQSLELQNNPALLGAL